MAARAAEAAAEAKRRLEAEAAARERDRAVAKQSGLLKALGESSGKGSSSDSRLDRVLSDVSVLSNPSLPASGHGSGLLSTTNSAPSSGEQRVSVDDLVAGLKTPGSEAIILSGKSQTRVESSLAVPSAGSTRSLESIRQETKALDTWLKFKYRETLRAQPTLGATLTVEFTITPQGGVTDCRVAASDLHAPQLEAAILKRFCLLRFAPLPEGSDDEVTVRYPIDFEGLGS
jgi:TonB family protein